MSWIPHVAEKEGWTRIGSLSAVNHWPSGSSSPAWTWITALLRRGVSPDKTGMTTDLVPVNEGGALLFECAKPLSQPLSPTWAEAVHRSHWFHKKACLQGFCLHHCLCSARLPAFLSCLLCGGTKAMLDSPRNRTHSYLQHPQSHC